MQAAVLVASIALTRACVPNPIFGSPEEYCLSYSVFNPSAQTAAEGAATICTPFEDPNVNIAVKAGQTLLYPLSGITRDSAPFTTNPSGVDISWDDVDGEYKVRWASSSTEDVQGYQCLDIARIGGQQTPQSAKAETCTQRVCRKLCTRPKWLQAAGMTVLDDSDVTNLRWRYNTQAKVGQKVSFELEAVNFISDDLVTIEGAVEGGIPIGLTFRGPSTRLGNRWSRTIEWTPKPGQEGRMFTAHFAVAAVSAPDSPGADLCGVSRSFLSVDISVLGPNVDWEEPEDKAYEVVVGEPLEEAFMCRSTLYRPKTALANVTVDGVEVTGGGQAGMYDLTIVNPPVGSASRESRVSFKYVSGGGDEASTKQFCFSCADALGMLEPKQRCFTIFTKLCEVYVKRDDTLHDLTRRYHLDRNWRRLWNLNDLQNPYLVLHSGTKLRIGPVYAVRRGDTLGSIAALFETTVKKILMHNPHLDHVEEDGLQIGTDICLLPCSNRRPPSHFDNKLYEQ